MSRDCDLEYTLCVYGAYYKAKQDGQSTGAAYHEAKEYSNQKLGLIGKLG